MPLLINGQSSIDASKEDSYNNKVLDERESRKRLLTFARVQGFEKDLLLLFAKFDKMIKSCPNEEERKDMQKLACIEVYKLITSKSGRGELTLDGKVVL